MYDYTDVEDVPRRQNSGTGGSISSRSIPPGRSSHMFHYRVTLLPANHIKKTGYEHGSSNVIERFIRHA